VVDRLKELGYTVVPVNVANSTDMRDASGELQFVDLRSALWWALRDNLDPAGEQPLAWPDDPLLVGDLTAPRWTYTSRGRIKVEGKDEIRKRLKRSTDGADALALAWYAPRSRRMRRSGDPVVG
jgi:hypothetical protein